MGEELGCLRSQEADEGDDSWTGEWGTKRRKIKKKILGEISWKKLH